MSVYFNQKEFWKIISAGLAKLHPELVNDKTSAHANIWYENRRLDKLKEISLAVDSIKKELEETKEPKEIEELYQVGSWIIDDVEEDRKNGD